MLLALILALVPTGLPSNSTLSISPLNPVVGTPVIVSYQATTECDDCEIDFGDDSPTEPVNGDQSVLHEYKAPGTYVITLLYDGMRTLQSASVTVEAAPIAHVEGISLGWPGGAADLTLARGAPVPVPTGYVRVAGPGQLQVIWLVDGTIVLNQTMQAPQAGAYKAILGASLPTSGKHTVEFRVVVPADKGIGTTASSSTITYGFENAP
jgi:hypothetical protein